jgi:subtilisin-like proprotein convertase family protein
LVPAPNPNTFANFIGESITGTWTLQGTDSVGGDIGTVGGWAMNITTNAIPEPGSILLLSAFGLVGLVRRHRS